MNRRAALLFTGSLLAVVVVAMLWFQEPRRPSTKDVRGPGKEWITGWPEDSNVLGGGWRPVELTDIRRVLPEQTDAALATLDTQPILSLSAESYRTFTGEQYVPLGMKRAFLVRGIHYEGASVEHHLMRYSDHILVEEVVGVSRKRRLFKRPLVILVDAQLHRHISYFIIGV